MSASKVMAFEWLATGDSAFAAAADAIRAAQHSVRLEAYTYADSHVGLRTLGSLLQARQRGVQVQVLVDAVGSIELSDSFWNPLRAAGAEVRWFNPLSLERFAIRDHRKLLVCDERVAIIGGYNIAPDYEGDGVQRGWRDLGLRLEGELATELAASFDDLFERADFRHPRIFRLRRFNARRTVERLDWRLLLSGPGWGRNPYLGALNRDLAGARVVQVVTPYFLPTQRLRRKLARVARRGGRVQLILPGKSDVQLSQLAARSLYRRLLNAGVEIYEYQPQVLHAKLVVVDGVVYLGSANLDPRSLRINYELMVRFENEALSTAARTTVAHLIEQSRRVEAGAWRVSRSWWDRFKQRWAHFFLARVDPFVASWQFRRLKN